MWIIYLAGVGCSEGLAGAQSQLADVVLARDDQIGHNEGEGAGQALAGRQSRADRQQPVCGRGRVVGHFVQDAQRRGEFTVPGAERERQWWSGLRRRERTWFYWMQSLIWFCSINAASPSLLPVVVSPSAC